MLFCPGSCQAFAYICVSSTAVGYQIICSAFCFAQPFKTMLFFFSFKKDHCSAVQRNRGKPFGGPNLLKITNRVKGKGNGSCFCSNIQVCALLNMCIINKKYSILNANCKSQCVKLCMYAK